MIVTAAFLLLPGAGMAQPVVSAFPPPAPTAWAPTGCRAVRAEDPALPGRETWTNMHGDLLGGDEIERVIGPMLFDEWTAEAATYNPTGPSFDRDNNVYFSPLAPHENVVLISVDPSDGSRRWAITGTSAAVPGGSAPMVLDDPDNPGEQIIYLALYDRALAVEPDGTVVWDVPTGLTLPVDPLDSVVLGVNYLPQRDAIIGVTNDGHVYALDRVTGTSILTSVFALPGEPSPDLPLAVPPAALALAEDAWQVLVDLPDGSLDTFVNVVLGQDTEVANMYSVDPTAGRIWIAATAPDAEDGTVDGVSEFGALYGLDVVPDGSAFEIVEACHASFAGGSASTPALRADGSRVYMGDNVGKLLSIAGTDCTIEWELDVGQQIVGSIAVSSDNDVVYASSRDFITQVFEQGTAGVAGWQAALDGLFDNLAPGQVEFNINLISIGAAGLGFQGGAGVILNNVPFAVAVGTGVLDRETGAVRHFTAAPEETVAVMTSAGDGSLYLGNSPVRRAFAIGLGLSSDPLVGGITKFGVARHDLLGRDASCAAYSRALNAATYFGTCPDSAAADGGQIGQLIAQVSDIASPEALAKGEITASKAAAVDVLLTQAETAIDAFVAGGDVADLDEAATHLGGACAAFGVCPASPMTGCRPAERSTLRWTIKGGDRDKLSWKWKKGESLSLADISDPTSETDHGVCVYAGSPPQLVASMTVPADALRWSPSGSAGFQFKDKAKVPADDGIARVKIKASDAGKSSAKVGGKGDNLPEITLPASLPVTVQLANRDTGICVTSVYASEDVSKNDASQLKAKTSP
jgi:outer membrane protein assembly factor BamB